MQLRPPTRLDRPADLATALDACAAAHGHRPAVTVLGTDDLRAEQGFAGLRQWAAKGAHLLQMDAALQPGDRVLVDVPPGWTLAAVCAAVWWAGGSVVTTGAADAEALAAAVVHESRAVPDIEVVYVVGDAVDGGTTGDSPLYAWSEEVQAFPDQPPAIAARPDLVALVDADGARTHDALVTAVHGQSGALGVDLGTYDGDGIAEVVARPFVTGAATVVVAAGLDRERAARDGVTGWA